MPLNSLKTNLQNPKICVQPKLTINTPGDQYEQEADAMADRVMRMSSNETVKPVTGLIGKSLQRKCAHCEEEKRRKPIMRKTEGVNSGMPVSSSFAASLSASKGGGMPLPRETKNFMENAFSMDFSSVKIHTGSQASKMSKSINAKAFTTGTDIYFGAGRYSPNTYYGKSLLAHELTHVLQQGQEVRRQVAAEPEIRGCTTAITGQANASHLVTQTIALAESMVNSAIGLLENPPTAGTVYQAALGTHFGSISERARLNIRRQYNRLLPHFRPANFICNSGRICEDRTQAFWLASDDLIHVCPTFWGLSPNSTCQAIIFIHEIAHDAGIDNAFWTTHNFHPANRGDRTYPIMGEPAPPVIRSARALMPDAFAFFSAHVHNGVDTPGACF